MYQEHILRSIKSQYFERFPKLVFSNKDQAHGIAVEETERQTTYNNKWMKRFATASCNSILNNKFLKRMVCSHFSPSQWSE